MRIAYDNFIDDLEATAITTTTENTNYPRTNIQDQRIAIDYRSTALSSQTIRFDLGSAHSCSIVAIAGHNFTSGVTATLYANSTDTWPGTTIGSVAYNSDIMLLFFSPSSYRYWRLVISDAANPDGYLSIGRIWIGDYISINPSALLDFVVIKKSSDLVNYGRGRQKYSSPGTTWRRFELSFPTTGYTMIDQISDMFDVVGKHSSLIFCNFDSIRTYPLVDPCYCSIQNDIDFKHKKSMKFSYSLVLEEDK